MEGYKHRIFIGRSAESEAVVGAKAFDELGEEESAVFAKGNDLFLIGGDPLGVLWAVYDFCEDSLGYRWLLERPDGEKIVKTDIVRFNGIPTRRRPKMLGYRYIEWRPESQLFALRNRSNKSIEKLCTNVVYKFTSRVPGHGFNIFLPKDGRTWWHDYAVPKQVRLPEHAFRDHPEWFSLMPDGTRDPDHQICLSNPGCRQELTRIVLEWMQVSGPGVYQVGVNDARLGALCNCNGCKALSRKYNTNGGPLWDYLLDLCAAVTTMFPQGGYYVQSLAYDGLGQTEKAPDNVVFPENFIADIAYIHICDRPIKQLPDQPAPEGEMVNYWQNTLKWNRITKHQSYWYYGTACPMFVCRRMQEEIRQIREAGIESVYTCGHGGGYEFGDLTGRLALRLLYDPDCDIRKDLEEAVAFKYGPAAPEMLAFIDSLEDVGLRKIAASGGQVVNAERPYQGMGFLKGRDLADWQMLFAAAEKKLKDSTVSLQPSTSTFYAENVRNAKLVVDLFTVLLEKRVRSEAPDFAFDVKAVEAEGRAIAEAYGKKYLRKEQKNEALELFVSAAKEMAYYGDLRDESLPKELAGYQASFVTRILPVKSEPFFCCGPVKGVLTSESDPQAACGYRVVDNVKAESDFSKGIPYYLWDGSAAKRVMYGKIPLSALKKDRYVLFKAGVTEVSPAMSLIVDEMWASPLSYRYISRCHNPAAPKTKYEIWLSLKAEGSKFFPGDVRRNRLSYDQIFVCEVIGSGN